MSEFCKDCLVVKDTGFAPEELSCLGEYPGEKCIANKEALALKALNQANDARKIAKLGGIDNVDEAQEVSL